MVDTVKVSNIPDSGSGQRVAFDLMERIANAEYRESNMPPENPRQYYLALYAECRGLTH